MASRKRGRKPGEPIERMSDEAALAAAHHFGEYAREVQARMRTGWMTGVVLTWSREKGFTWSLYGELDNVETARRS